ncbi:GSCOCG00008180001-RA-CDS, partial [Cotesia congregata]
VLTARYWLISGSYIGIGIGNHANAQTGPPTKNVGTLLITADSNNLKLFHPLSLFSSSVKFSSFIIFILTNSKITLFIGSFRKLLAYLNLDPTVKISWIKSSTQMMSVRPKQIYRRL